jgi:hypothetical protein
LIGSGSNVRADNPEFSSRSSGRLAVWDRTLGKNAGLMGPRPSAVVAVFEEDGLAGRTAPLSG